MLTDVSAKTAKAWSVSIFCSFIELAIDQSVVQQHDRLSAQRNFLVANGDEIQTAVGIAAGLNRDFHLAIQALQVNAAR